MGAHLRKSLGLLEKSAGRNMDVKGYSGKVSEGSENYGRESFLCLKKYKYYPDLDVARDGNINGASGETLEVEKCWILKALLHKGRKFG